MALQVGRGSYMMQATCNTECLYVGLEAILERPLNDLVAEKRNDLVVHVHAKTNRPSERAYGTKFKLMKNMYMKGGSSEKIPLG